MSEQTSLLPPKIPGQIVRGGECVFGAIDPGLDRVSLAIFRYTIESRDRWRFAGLQDKARQFDRVLHVSTSAKLGLAERLELVARGTHAMIKNAGVHRLVIEQPPGGTYQRIADTGIGTGAGSRFAAMLQTTAFATGAIMAAARTVLGDRVEFVKAQTGKKEDRLERVRMLLVSVKCRERVKNSDDLDAIGIGLGADWIG
jgi:Holliday junction resolvasome RuvABC endonuclease subunit